MSMSELVSVIATKLEHGSPGTYLVAKSHVSLILEDSGTTQLNKVFMSAGPDHLFWLIIDDASLVDLKAAIGVYTPP